MRASYVLRLRRRVGNGRDDQRGCGGRREDENWTVLRQDRRMRDDEVWRRQERRRGGQEAEGRDRRDVVRR